MEDKMMIIDPHVHMTSQLEQVSLELSIIVPLDEILKKPIMRL